MAISDEESVWHKRPMPLVPRKTVDGKWTIGYGQFWRRKRNGKWQYKMDEDPYDD
jgi:hypothetical protein